MMIMMMMLWSSAVRIDKLFYMLVDYKMENLFLYCDLTVKGFAYYRRMFAVLFLLRDQIRILWIDYCL